MTGEMKGPSDKDSIRRILAFAVVAVGSIIAVLSIWLDALQVCKDATGTTDGKLVAIPSCSPWSISEIVPFAIVALALLAPDLTEVSIANLFSLKRRVEEQEIEVKATAKRQDILETQLSLQMQNFAGATSQAVSQPTINFGNEYLARLSMRLSDKASELPEGSRRALDDRASQIESATSAQMSDDRLSMMLINTWAKIQPYVDLARLPTTEQIDPLNRWNSLFKEELATVRAVRDSVANGRPVNRETLEFSVRAAVQLESYLNDLGISTS